MKDKFINDGVLDINSGLFYTADVAEAPWILDPEIRPVLDKVKCTIERDEDIALIRALRTRVVRDYKIVVNGTPEFCWGSLLEMVAESMPTRLTLMGLENVTTQLFPCILGQMLSLEYLEIVNCQLSVDYINADVPAVATLTELRLELDNTRGNLFSHCETLFSLCPHLTTLTLFASLTSSGWLHALSRASCLSRLHTLRLTITSQCFPATEIALYETFKKLRCERLELSFEGSLIANVVPVISAALKIKGLREFHVYVDRLEGSDTRPIVFFPEDSQLEALVVFCPHVSDESALPCMRLFFEASRQLLKKFEWHVSIPAARVDMSYPCFLEASTTLTTFTYKQSTVICFEHDNIFTVIPTMRNLEALELCCAFDTLTKMEPIHAHINHLVLIPLLGGTMNVYTFMEAIRRPDLVDRLELGNISPTNEHTSALKFQLKRFTKLTRFVIDFIELKEGEVEKFNDFLTPLSGLQQLRIDAQTQPINCVPLFDMISRLPLLTRLMCHARNPRAMTDVEQDSAVLMIAATRIEDYLIYDASRSLRNRLYPIKVRNIKNRRKLAPCLLDALCAEIGSINIGASRRLSY